MESFIIRNQTEFTKITRYKKNVQKIIIAFPLITNNRQENMYNNKKMIRDSGKTYIVSRNELEEWKTSFISLEGRFKRSEKLG